MENPEIFERVFDGWAKEVKDWSEDMKTDMKSITRFYPKLSEMALIPEDKSEYRKQWILHDDKWISVIRGYGTYGSAEGLFEVWGSGMDAPEGYLTSKEVLKLGEKIKNDFKEEIPEIITPRKE